MARIRTIKPDFFKNEQLSELEPMNRLLFIGLWTQADREGKLEDRPKRLKVEIFPYDEFDINKALFELQSVGLLIRYVVKVHDIENYFIKILTFEKHQQPNIKEAKSTIPEPENCKTLYKHSAYTVQASQERKGTGRERKGKEGDRGGKIFSPPIFNDLVDYFFLKKENDWPAEKIQSEAQKFIDHYTSNGWKVGKNKMTVWKAAASGWINRDKEFTQNKKNYNGPKNGSAIETIGTTAVEYYKSKYGDIDN